MARPKNPPALPTDLTRDLWEDTPGFMERARAVGAQQGMMEIVAVLTNERPSAAGIGSLDFVHGYEFCLSQLREMLKGRRRPEPEQEREPSYDGAEQAIKESWGIQTR